MIHIFLMINHSSCLVGALKYFQIFSMVLIKMTLDNTDNVLSNIDCNF